MRCGSTIHPAKRARRIGQRFGRNHVAAGDMGKVGTQARTCIRAANRVAHQACMSEKNFPPADGFTVEGSVADLSCCCCHA